MSDDLNLIERYRMAWQVELDRLGQMIAQCTTDHSTPPPNYWVPEYEARKKYEMALTVFSAIHGEPQ